MENKTLVKILSVFLSMVLLSVMALLSCFTYVDLSIKAEAKTISEYDTGDTIEFGSYPQSIVTDEQLLSELNSLPLSWVSYGYYSGSGEDGSMLQGDWMKYADVRYGVNKYRAVTFSQYRPGATCEPSSASYTFQDENGYSTNTVYWFKYEHLKWRVLDSEEGLVMCESIIDSQAYSNTIYYSSGYYYNSTSCTSYASDYATSSIRKWLNEDFYNTAFTSCEKAVIDTTTLDNSCPWDSEFDSETTNDKIFLLSYDEVLNTDYGFSSSYSTADTTRRAGGTDYAKCQGLSWIFRPLGMPDNGSFDWWLRSPYNYAGNSACGVEYVGTVIAGFGVGNTVEGVRPAFSFNLKSENQTHSYISEVTKQPTCTEKGIKTFICTDCEDFYIEEIEIIPHDYDDKGITTQPSCTTTGIHTFQCSVCGDSYTEDVAIIPHDYADKGITTQPTCTSTGLRTFQCSVCGDSYAEDVKIIPHDYVDKGVTTQPTCTTTGKHTFQCSVCGDSYTEDVVTIPHDYVDKGITTQPTCTSTGLRTFQCSVCGDSYAEDVATIPHNYIDRGISPQPTCTSGGLQTFQCTMCFKPYINPVPATGHIFGSWKVVKEATVTEDGEKQRGCTKCGYVEREFISKTPFVLETQSLNMNYKATAYLEAEGEAEFTWTSSDESIIKVDEKGNIIAVGVGTANIIVTVDGTDFEETCTVIVSYAWWQWLIIIFLFGWIWYI